MRRVHVVASGLVQGVGFRWSTLHEAQRRGLSGWVRNLHDGTVEAEVEGPEDTVEEMLEWLAIGPRYARVTDLAVRDLTPTGDPGFEVC